MGAIQQTAKKLHSLLKNSFIINDPSDLKRVSSFTIEFLIAYFYSFVKCEANYRAKRPSHPWSQDMACITQSQCAGRPPVKEKYFPNSIVITHNEATDMKKVAFLF